MGFPWRRILSFGLAGASKIAPFLPGKFGTVTGVIVDEIHTVENVATSTGLSGLQKALHVENSAIDAVNAVAAAAGKTVVVDAELKLKIQAAIDANVALENAIAERVHSAPAVAA